jgi:N-methylhydantoinase A
VTDAHVVLGHLPARLLGGRMALDAEAANRAIDSKVARPLGLTREEAARGMLAILDNNMMGALRIVSVERGHDPRDFTLVPFGGAGPLHGCALAELLGIRRVLIPTAPGVLCADGLLAADLKADFSRTLPRTGKVDLDAARQIYAALSQQADDWLAHEKVAPADRKQVRMALMRYHGQGGEVAVGWVDDAAGVEAAFAEAHRALYGFTLDSAIELVTLRVEATGRMPAPLRPELPSGSGAKPQDHHTVHFASGTAPVPLFNRAAFGAGDRFAGPAIISQLDATTLVLPNWLGEVHSSGAILLTLARH